MGTDKRLTIFKFESGAVGVAIDNVSLEESIYMLEVAKRELFRLNEQASDISMRRYIGDDNKN